MKTELLHIRRVGLVCLLICVIVLGFFSEMKALTAAEEAKHPLAGKVVFLAGDSRSSTDYTFYGEQLEQKAGVTALVEGASGRTAAYNASDAYFERLAASPHDFSIWLVGGNDDGSPGTVGTFDADSELACGGEPVVAPTDVSRDYDGECFIQAVDHIMRKYMAEFGAMEGPGGLPPVMIFCTDLPQQREGPVTPWSQRENWERKRLAILECCARNGMTCVDLYALCGFDMSVEPWFVPPTDKVNDRGVYYMDGLHPNARGMDVITDLEIQEMMNCSGDGGI